MAVGHPDYWSRMISRISVQGYVPEYYHWMEGAVIASGASDVMLQYAIPVGYIYNIIGFGATCKEPGICQVSCIKQGGNGMTAFFDTTYQNEMPIGMFDYLVYGDTLRFTLVNLTDRSAQFYGWVQCVSEFIG